MWFTQTVKQEHGRQEHTLGGTEARHVGDRGWNAVWVCSDENAALDLLFKYWSHSATILPSRVIPVTRDTSFMFRKQKTLWTRTCWEALRKEPVWWLRDERSHRLCYSFVTGWGQISCLGQILGVQVFARDHYTMTCEYWRAKISSQQRCEDSLVPGKHRLFFFFFFNNTFGN